MAAPDPTFSKTSPLTHLNFTAVWKNPHLKLTPKSISTAVVVRSRPRWIELGGSEGDCSASNPTRCVLNGLCDTGWSPWSGNHCPELITHCCWSYTEEIRAKAASTSFTSRSGHSGIVCGSFVIYTCGFFTVSFRSLCAKTVFPKSPVTIWVRAVTCV